MFCHKEGVNMTRNISLTSIAESLDSVAANYASLVKKAEKIQCPIAMLPEAPEKLTEIKKELESLLEESLCLTDPGEELEARNRAVVLLNAVNSALCSY